MPDRRRTPRYVLNEPLIGEAMPMQDAMVEHYSGDRLVVIAPSAHRLNEVLTVHVPMPGGLTSHEGVVMSSSAVSVGGTVCFRLELRIARVETVPDPEGHA